MFSLKILGLILAVSSIGMAEEPTIAQSYSESKTSKTKKKKVEEKTFERGSCFDAGYQPHTGIWGDAEYLYWWTKNAPLHTPLVTTGSAADAIPAALGQPHTKVLYGKHDIHNGGQSGIRLALRTWVGGNKAFGIEGAGFYLPKKSKQNFSISSGPDGEILAVPFFNESVSTSILEGGWRNIFHTGETALLVDTGTLDVSNPVFASISVTSSTQLWGLELNGLYNFWRKEHIRFSVLLGVTYIDLQDALSLQVLSKANESPTAVFAVTSIRDHFRTRNEFYGGQVAFRSEWSDKWFFANLLAKVALGDMIENIHINGHFSDAFPNIYLNYGNGTGGIFAQPSNIGASKKNKFAVVPQVNLRLGLNLCTSLRLSVGYDFLYLSTVVRPGDEIDRSINETQAGPSINHEIPIVAGPLRPKRLHETTDYWAQGINAGVEFRF